MDFLRGKYTLSIDLKKKMSQVMRKVDVCICKNKGANKLCSNWFDWGAVTACKSIIFPLHAISQVVYCRILG